MDTRNEEGRAEAFEENQIRLEQFAHRILLAGRSLREMVVVCIDANADCWKFLVEMLMPGHDWQSIRDQGAHPFARGSQERKFVYEVLIRTCPDVAFAIKNPPPAGLTYAVIFGENGVSIYPVEPRPEPS
ncbi:MAG: hypothetical protein Q7N87_01300 [Candidatus Uhrbacteria bacterium]|nr:hypothetical protein [Candidatus Uhrbacteria bacterium]MDP3793712.1 hypothetical protein [Candidatus Uhrbacteria bacterium]